MVLDGALSVLHVTYVIQLKCIAIDAGVCVVL